MLPRSESPVERLSHCVESRCCGRQARLDDFFSWKESMPGAEKPFETQFWR